MDAMMPPIYQNISKMELSKSCRLLLKTTVTVSKNLRVCLNTNDIHEFEFFPLRDAICASQQFFPKLGRTFSSKMAIFV